MKLHIAGRDWSTFTTGSVEIRPSFNSDNVIFVGKLAMDGSVEHDRDPIFYSGDQILDVVGDEGLLLRPEMARLNAGFPMDKRIEGRGL